MKNTLYIDWATGETICHLFFEDRISSPESWCRYFNAGKKLRGFSDRIYFIS